MKLQFTVTVEMGAASDLPDPVVGDPLEALMMRSARQAVERALEKAQQVGFHHDLEEVTCIEVMDVEPAVRVYDKLARVRGEFLDEDGGATLHCDACGEQVRSNEVHTCPPLPDPYDVFVAPQASGLRRLIYSAGGGVLHVHYLTREYHQPRLEIARGGELWGSQTFDPPRVWEPAFLQDGIESEVWSWLDPEEAWTVK
jgi:hypothetical protein